MKANEAEKVKSMYLKYGHRCFVCGLSATQRALIISDTKTNRKVFGAEIIDNALNWLPACSLRCNSLIDVGKSPVIKGTISALIRQRDSSGIEKLVRGNIERKRMKAETSLLESEKRLDQTMIEKGGE